jgi:hypothetical protein
VRECVRVRLCARACVCVCENNNANSHNAVFSYQMMYGTVPAKNKL